MAGGHDWAFEGERLSNLSPGGIALNIPNLDVNLRTLAASGTITGPGGGFGPSTIQVALDATWLAANGWVFANNTAVSLTVTAISVIYTTAGGASATLDFRKIPVGVVATTGGVTLLTAVVQAGSGGQAQQLFAPTLTATLADRILAPSEKISCVTGGTMTAFNGGVVTINYQS